MSGFMGSTAAMTIFEAKCKPSQDSVRAHAFEGVTGPDGKRIGWVGLGDPLDTDFDFGIDFGHYLAWSLRIDERKPSGAAIKIRLAEAVREEIQNNGRISSKRKKELKENITAKVLSKTDYTPSLTDCILDVENNRLYVSTASRAVLDILIPLFNQTFSCDAEPIFPNADMADVFKNLFESDRTVDSFQVFGADNYSVSLATPPSQEDKASVGVNNNPESIKTALSQGLAITKMAICATENGVDYNFTLAQDLSVSGIKLPKGEKGDEPDTVLLLKADTLTKVAKIVEGLAK